VPQCLCQREDVERHLKGAGGTLITTLEELERGQRNDRPKLVEALAICRTHGRRSLPTNRYSVA